MRKTMDTVRNLSHEELLKLSNEQSKKITRESIITALILLFAEKPFEKITITDIAKKAGVSRTAFYSNFESKEDVAKELGKNITVELNEFFAGNRYSGDGRVLLLGVFTAIKENPDRMKVLFNSKQMVHEILGGETYLDTVMKAEDSFGYYNIFATEAALKKIIVEWFRGGMKESPEDMAQYCSDLSRKIIVGVEKE